MAGKKPKYATPESAALAAELDMREAERLAGALDRNADFHAAWAERMKRPTPPAAPPSELHVHTDECFAGSEVETRWINNVLGWYTGRMCKAKYLFVPIAPAKNPNATGGQS